MILDLEDSVAACRQARPPAAAVAEWLRVVRRRRSQVRVNAPGTADLAADLLALPPGVPLRLPKVESPGDLVAPWPAGAVHALLETALGVEDAFAIARAPGVVSLGARRGRPAPPTWASRARRR